jgi:flagellar biosynthetic protein FlhB
VVGEKTEQPTPRKRQDARRRGQVAISREAESAFVLFAAFATMRVAGPRLWSGLEGLMRDSFAQLDENQLNTDLAAVVGEQLVWRAVLLLLPLLLAIVAVGAIGGVAQTGGVLSLQPLKPQLGRLNPLKGLKRVFASKQAAMTFAKSVAKFGVLGGVAALTLWERREEMAALGIATPLGESLRTIHAIGFDLTLRVLVALLLMATLDFIFQRYDMTTQLKMTRQEVKDELRQSEGDPLVRGRAATLRRSFLTRVMEAVPSADVVLTNPTTYAVALKYDPATSSAPIVVAKGRGYVAERIRELAREHGVPVLENPPLTRTLFRAVAIGQEIGADLYEAVAEVLAFVYRMRYPAARAVA